MNMTIDKACGFCRQSRDICIDEHTPSGSKFKVFLIRCMPCGAIIGVLDFTPTGEILEEIEKTKEAMQITSAEILSEIKKIKAAMQLPS